MEVRNGIDLLKAKALGATAVLLGALLVWFECKGYEGVKTTIDIFKKEADIALALCGETNINNLSKKNIVD